MKGFTCNNYFYFTVQGVLVQESVLVIKMDVECMHLPSDMPYGDIFEDNYVAIDNLFHEMSVSHHMHLLKNCPQEMSIYAIICA